jgi:hypothetical protein
MRVSSAISTGRKFFSTAVAASAVLIASGAGAQEFAALVSPPRVETSVEPGKTVRQVLEISHVGAQSSTYRIYTADWSLAADGSVNFFEPLQPNSCRPWVALERRELTLAPQGKHRFRFEIAAPAHPPVGECRFAVMIEGRDVKVNTASGVTFPMAGRIGVIVYANVGKGAPVIEIVRAGTELLDGRATPVLTVRNTGNAHGRLSGFLNATDANGKTFELSPTTLPILAGETRKIALLPAAEDKLAAAARFPLRVAGTIEWADKKTAVTETFNVPAAPPAVPAPAPNAAPQNVEAQKPGK